MRRIWVWIICAVFFGLIFIWPRRRIARHEEQLLTKARPAPVPYKPPAAQPTAAAARTFTEKVAESAPPQKPDNRADDLTLLEGVGPKIAAALNAAGIKTYAQLAALTPEALERTVKTAGVRMVGHADSWPRQARLAAEGKLDELRAYQQTLRANRKTSGNA
jgi:predicted flap endonuclease-1-like 5' DNA nuclease